MKILIATPDEGKLLDLTVRSIAKQRCPQGVERLDHVILRDYKGIGLSKQEKVARQYNTAIDLALGGGYDALVAWENDIIVNNPYVVDNLFKVNADVVHATYVFRKPDHPWNLAFVDGMKAYHLSSFPDEVIGNWGKVVDVDGYGLGCTLIRRDVLKNIQFRSTGLLHEDGKESHCDWYFAQDLLQMTVGMASSRPVVKGHLGVTVGHVHHHPTPHILYPVRHDKAIDPRFPYVAMPFDWAVDISLIPNSQRQRQFEQLRLMNTETSEYLDLLYQEAGKLENSSALLEIGVNYGVSTTALLAGKPSESILRSVDVNPCERARERLQETLVWDWEFFQTDSLDPDLKSHFVDRDIRFGLLLVDGLHTYQQVYSELLLYSPLISEEGVILVHDVLLHEPVARAVEAFCGLGGWTYEVYPGYCGMAVLRRHSNGA
jgi:predicted O-methyltransferase YrrM